MAAVLAVTLDNTVRKEANYSLPETVFWSDSMIVLGYLNNESKRFKTFVANRVSKILSTSSKYQWRHVPTELNPADDGSRGTYNLSKWTTGPNFLKQGEASWPAMKMFECSPSDVEVKKDVMVAQASVFHEISENNIVTSLASKYSSWTKLLRVTAWSLRFTQNLKAKMNNQQKTTGSLSVCELKESESLLLANEQRRFLSHWKSDKGMRQLNVVLMGNLLRVGGRLENAQMDFESKHPIVLSGKSSVTKLIIRHHHALVGHSGVATTLTAIRNRFHIVKGKCVVKGVIRDCVTCKKLNARPAEQIMAPLPAERVVADQPPFTNTGVDYFGPIEVRERRSTVKRYGCIFTCLSSRAVHLEVAESLEADAFINAFRRFVARRGQPLKMFSDNGTNFVAGERELREALDNMNNSVVEDALHTRGCEWHFNPPAASHFGGVWERLIRSVRKVLHGVLRQQTLTTEVLHTLLTEVESILNSRPLTDLSLDQNHDPLTPNHLLLLRSGPSAPVGKLESFGRRRWLQVQYLASLFWSLWKREYLPLLQKRHKWTTPRQNVAVDDIVLLVDEMLPRGKWPMGKVLSVKRSNDDRVRSVDVKVTGGVLKRPVSKLCIVHRGLIHKDDKC
ncbi:uncharacterized protein LOC117100976 [Anneissia japonica]|uniref:uncharacterized protein LOC117100976 n=1 Tax=Anneissia japonica TaxID=1529436 RepID=UPI0014259A6F|nr:uncharacterized protein LOC117100976 [Anneissia japonica]